MRRISFLIAVAILCTPAFAENPGAADHAKAVAPFVDDQTFAVGYMDAQRIDLDAAESTIIDIVKAIDPKADDNPGLAQVREAKQAARAWLTEFTKAGGTTVYAVSSVADISASEGEPSFIAPLAPTANARAIAALLFSGKPDGPTTRPPDESTSPRDRVCDRIGSAMVAGPRGALQRLRTVQPMDRPEILKAFEAAGDSPVQILFVPPAYARRVVEETLPTLPPVLGGGPSTIITRGLTWGAVSFDLRQGVSARAIIQSQDATSAQALAGLVDQALQAAQKTLDVVLHGPEIGETIILLKPSVKDDRVILELRPETFRLLLSQVLAPPLGRARELARRTASAKNMHGILTACFRYGADHKGQWPQDLKSLIPNYVKNAKMLVNPRRTELEVGYAYIRPAMPIDKVDPRGIVLYEAYEKWDEGVNVGFGDGHVDFMGNETEFKKMLAEAQSATSAPGAK